MHARIQKIQKSYKRIHLRNYLGSVKKSVGFLKFNDCPIILNLNMANQNFTPAVFYTYSIESHIFVDDDLGLGLFIWLHLLEK